MSRHQKMTPEFGNAAKKGYATHPQRRWDEVPCQLCRGHGAVYDRGTLVRCPQCSRSVSE